MQEVDLAIGENAIDIISNSIRNLEKIESFDSKYQETANNLKSAYYELQEVSRDITNYKDEVDFDENEQKQIEERLDLIFSLKRKAVSVIKNTGSRSGNKLMRILKKGSSKTNPKDLIG